MLLSGVTSAGELVVTAGAEGVGEVEFTSVSCAIAIDASTVQSQMAQVHVGRDGKDAEGRNQDGKEDDKYVNIICFSEKQRRN